MRDFYLKLPIPLDFRIYFFNVTNPLQVQEGQKPILQEVGPYCYDAYKEKIVIAEDKANDTLTYNPYDTYFFNQTRSGDLSQDDYVTILNPLVVGIINAVAIQKPQFLSAVNKALPIVFKEDYSIYLTTRVRDILFDGVRIDCNVKDFSATALCSQFKGQPVMKEIEKNVFYFSLFGSRNGTVPQQITVYRGIKNGESLGEVVSIDNHTDLQIWPKGSCNKYRGTDGWIFPPFLKDNIDIVAPDLCRNFQAKFVETLRFHNIKVRKYFADLGEANPEDQCFCPAPDKCLPEGVVDLTKCLQVPLMCTLPHFLRVDEKLLQQVEGLHPDTEKHIILIYFESITGTPVVGQRRIQFNLELKTIKKINIMQTVPEALHPILWLEEGVQLEGFLLDKIITASTLLKVVSVGRYITLIGFIEIFAYGCYQAYKDWKLSKVGPAESPSKSVRSSGGQHRKINTQEILKAINFANRKDEATT
ncbi:sensory neuron membrane protein 1-like [Zophobas morio]